MEYKNIYIRVKESTYLSLNLLPEESLNNADGSGYKAYFQVFLANSKPETYDLFEYAFSIEQDSNTVVVYDCVGNVKAMYPSQWVGLNDVKYIGNEGISVESAIVVYKNRS